ncbi:MAG: thioredoxin [Atopobiaceae bacterium]|jgi:thioredoxin 1|nr:thioredoxin [Atopobiaceae bacterium]MCH4181131.1 thioredoxin [Atopobiaceae bacterium]MCH4215024.1 thioredoxin [Atopobiaceae bacterium]MCH4229867.1 thioredoxin [Atopobiaceae bacterium]MCH4277006.1 thioredoxin [Atopobiaceae bacterium]
MEYRFTEKNFEQEVLKSDIPVVIDFYAEWCGPCRAMGPVVAELADAYDGKVKVGKVNSDEQQALAQRFNVMSIPSFFFIKDGKVVDSAVGGMPKGRLEQKIKALL